MARHAWQLDGYRVLGAAPTGIATVCLGSEGFEHARTVDRLLAELDHERDPRGRRRAADEPLLDARTVLVVDEAGMVGSRKLARLLDHAHQAGAKVILVGDDRQLAAIEAGGGFRGLRLRLGASELTENRRQQQTWEREAVEHLRNGDLDQALGAYRAHGRLVAAGTPTRLKELLLGDWWQAFQHGDRVAILAHRREEVDQFNTACQQLRDHAGHLDAERLQVGDRSFAVGDLVVCGKNALRSLGVANGSRGQVLALDRALVRVAGAEGHQWLYVAATRATQETTFFDVIGPEPRPIEPELDVPQAQPHSIHEDLIAVGRRDGTKQLAVDTSDQRQLVEQGLAEATAREQTARDRVAELGQGAGRLLHRRELIRARDQHPSPRPPRPWPASRPTGRPTANARPAAPSTNTSPTRSGTPAYWPPTGPALANSPGATGRSTGAGARAARLATRSRPAARQHQGPARLAAGCAHILQSRERRGITDPEHPLGPAPRHGTWSSADTTGPPVGWWSGSGTGSAPNVTSRSAGMSAPIPTSDTADPAKPTAPAQLGSISVSAAAGSAKLAERRPL